MRKLLFISYAYEDAVFAKWLARKLAFYGYGVWIDQYRILGGESWVEEVDIAIAERSCRVLAILSRDSINKDNPRKERTQALHVGKELGIKDFLIPLNLDGTRPDWTLSDLSWRSFSNGWSEGLRQLLEKLNAIDAPRIHEGNPSIASACLNNGEHLIQIKPSEFVCNWLKMHPMPEVLRIYKTKMLNSDERQRLNDGWPNYKVTDQETINSTLFRCGWRNSGCKSRDEAFPAKLQVLRIMRSVKCAGSERFFHHSEQR